MFRWSAVLKYDEGKNGILQYQASVSNVRKSLINEPDHSWHLVNVGSNQSCCFISKKVVVGIFVLFWHALDSH